MQAEVAANAILQAAADSPNDTNRNAAIKDDITTIVIFFDKKSIAKNLEKKEQSHLQNILSSENVIDEVSEEYLGTGQTFG